VYSQCAHDERTLARRRERQCALASQCGPICGDTIAGYDIRDDAIELRFQRGGRLRIAVCSAAAVASVTPPEAVAPLPGPAAAAAGSAGRARRLQPVCTLLFLPQQHERPRKKEKKKDGKKKRRLKPGEDPHIPKQEDFESV